MSKKQEPLFNGNTKCAKLPITLDDYKRIRKIIREGGGRFVARNLLLVNLQTNTCVGSSDVLKLKPVLFTGTAKLLKSFGSTRKKIKNLNL